MYAIGVSIDGRTYRKEIIKALSERLVRNRFALFYGRRITCDKATPRRCTPNPSKASSTPSKVKRRRTFPFELVLHKWDCYR